MNMEALECVRVCVTLKTASWVFLFCIIYVWLLSERISLIWQNFSMLLLFWLSLASGIMPRERATLWIRDYIQYTDLSVDIYSFCE